MNNRMDIEGHEDRVFQGGDKAAHYDAQYRKPNYFHYSRWMYARYIATLGRAAGLKRGARVLDVGCGQGFFSYLFCKQGMNVHGVDISEMGITQAKNLYGLHGVKFSVADILKAEFEQQYDCVFVRSCSLYNTEDFSSNPGVTEKLLRLVRPHGCLLFLYNSNFSGKLSSSWRYHSWDDLRRHFLSYEYAQVAFSTRIDTCLLGRFAFMSPVSRMNMLLSRVLGIGGDLVCIVKKS